MSSPTEARGDGLAHAALRATRRARLARALSWGAALLGLGFVAAFFIQAGLFAALLPKPPVEKPVISDPEEISASQSTVSGIDTQNQPYEVTASRGWQDKEKPNLVHLETIAAVFRKPDGRSYDLTSAKGLYDTKLKEMQLSGGVSIREGDRFTATMEQARVAVERKSLTSDVPVDVTFSNGSVHANGMQITDDGAKILFLNGVKAKIGVAATEGDKTP